MRHVDHVDPHGARLDPMRDAERPLDVEREDTSAKTVYRVVRHPDDFFFVVELDHDSDGAEDLFADDLHARLAVREDGRLDKVPRGPFALAPEMKRRTLLLAFFDVPNHALKISASNAEEKRIAD